MCYSGWMELCYRVIVMGGIILGFGPLTLTRGTSTIASINVLWSRTNTIQELLPSRNGFITEWNFLSELGGLSQQSTNVQYALHDFEAVRGSARKCYGTPMKFQSGGASMSIAVGSNLVIKCPNNATNPEYYKVYWVPQSAFSNCFLSNSDWNKTELLVNCNNPNRSEPLSFVTEITLFSGVPFAKDFEIGENYYIATFSTGTFNGLGNTYEGACLDYNMKLNLTVVDALPATTQASTNTTSSSTQSTTSSTRSSTTTQKTTSTSQSTTLLTSTLFSTRGSTSTDIPDQTDIIITVPGGGNTGIIDASSARTLCVSWVLLVLSVSLSLSFIVNFQQITNSVQR